MRRYTLELLKLGYWLSFQMSETRPVVIVRVFGVGGEIFASKSFPVEEIAASYTNTEPFGTEPVNQWIEETYRRAIGTT